MKKFAVTAVVGLVAAFGTAGGAFAATGTNLGPKPVPPTGAKCPAPGATTTGFAYIPCTIK